jgi:hypothetical protein
VPPAGDHRKKPSSPGRPHCTRKVCERVGRCLFLSEFGAAARVRRLPRKERLLLEDALKGHIEGP